MANGQSPQQPVQGGGQYPQMGQPTSKLGYTGYQPPGVSPGYGSPNMGGMAGGNMAYAKGTGTPMQDGIGPHGNMYPGAQTGVMPSGGQIDYPAQAGAIGGNMGVPGSDVPPPASSNPWAFLGGAGGGGGGFRQPPGGYPSPQLPPWLQGMGGMTGGNMAAPQQPQQPQQQPGGFQQNYDAIKARFGGNAADRWNVNGPGWDQGGQKLMQDRFGGAANLNTPAYNSAINNASYSGPGSTYQANGYVYSPGDFSTATNKIDPTQRLANKREFMQNYSNPAWLAANAVKTR